MSDIKADPISTFDSLFTNNQIQKLKLLLPFLDSSMQKTMAVCIKYMELQHTLTFLKKYPDASLFPEEASADTQTLCEKLMPYCSTQERSRLEQMKNMFSMMGKYREIMEMMSFMQEMFPEEGSPSEPSSAGMDLGALSELLGMGASSEAAGTDSFNKIINFAQAMSGFQKQPPSSDREDLSASEADTGQPTPSTPFCTGGHYGTRQQQASMDG